MNVFKVVLAFIHRPVSWRTTIAYVAAQKSRRLRGGIILSRICNRLGWARDRLMRADFTCGFTTISKGGPFDPLAGT